VSARQAAEQAVDAIVRRARTVAGLAGEIVDAVARADAADADRDYWRAQATMAAPCVDAVRAITTRLIPGGTGCAVDPERAVAAVAALAAQHAADVAAAVAAAVAAERARCAAVCRDIASDAPYDDAAQAWCDACAEAIDALTAPAPTGGGE